MSAATDQGSSGFDRDRLLSQRGTQVRSLTCAGSCVGNHTRAAAARRTVNQTKGRLSLSPRARPHSSARGRPHSRERHNDGSRQRFPSVDDRLGLVRELVSLGIPSSVHMSPIIPGVDTDDELAHLMDAMGVSGTSCIYACMLGVTADYYKLLDDVLSRHSPLLGVTFRAPYGPDDFPGVKSAPDATVWKLMSGLSRHAERRGLPFACVHIPVLDTVERNGGIFRFKLPNVGDISRSFDRRGIQEAKLETVLEWVRGFAAVDDAYIRAVSGYFADGTLFRNTYFHKAADSTPSA
jgi:hypothetical protein